MNKITYNDKWSLIKCTIFETGEVEDNNAIRMNNEMNEYETIEYKSD